MSLTNAAGNYPLVEWRYYRRDSKIVADGYKPSKENKSKSSASNVSTRSKNPNWEQDLRELLEENKAALISDIDKSNFIENFRSVSLRHEEILNEVADNDQNTKSKFEWMNMREHKSLMRKGKVLI